MSSAMEYCSPVRGQEVFNWRLPIGHFTVVYFVAKPLIWSEAEGDLVVLETRI